MIEDGLTTLRPLVLLCEDSEDDAHFAMRALDDQCDTGIAVVNSSSEALDFLFYQGRYLDRDPLHQPHLILLDCILPPDGGLEVLRHVRADDCTRLLPVVMLGSSKSEDAISECYAAGANSYVGKPGDAAAFKGLMQHLRAFWLRWNVPPFKGIGH